MHGDFKGPNPGPYSGLVILFLALSGSGHVQILWTSSHFFDRFFFAICDPQKLRSAENTILQSFSKHSLCRRKRVQVEKNRSLAKNSGLCFNMQKVFVTLPFRVFGVFVLVLFGLSFWGKRQKSFPSPKALSSKSCLSSCFFFFSYLPFVIPFKIPSLFVLFASSTL